MNNNLQRYIIKTTKNIAKNEKNTFKNNKKTLFFVVLEQKNCFCK